MAAQIPRRPTTAPTRTAADPTPTVPNPSPRRRSTVTRARVPNPTRRGGAGSGVAPGRRGSKDGCRSRAGPAPTAAPFLIAAFVPRAVGFSGVITGRREWEQAAGWQILRDSPRALASHASPPPPPLPTRSGLTLKLMSE